MNADDIARLVKLGVLKPADEMGISPVVLQNHEADIKRQKIDGKAEVYVNTTNLNRIPIGFVFPLPNGKSIIVVNPAFVYNRELDDRDKSALLEHETGHLAQKDTTRNLDQKTKELLADGAVSDPEGLAIALKKLGKIEQKVLGLTDEYYDKRDRLLDTDPAADHPSIAVRVQKLLEHLNNSKNVLSSELQSPAPASAPASSRKIAQ